MIPTSIIRIWFLGLFSWILLGAGIYLSHKWYQHAWSYDFKLQRSYFDPHIGYNNETLLLVLAAGLLLWILAGGVIVRSILSLILKSQSAGNRAAPPKRQSREGQRSPVWVGQMAPNYGSNVMEGRTLHQSF